MSDSVRFLRTADAARRIGLSPRTLEALRVRGGGPPYCSPPGRRIVVYSVDDLDTWLTSGRRSSTSDAGPDSAQQPEA